ncbi:MAG: glycosyltransferase family 2 protein, partial [Gemmatimonadaceae bacterium]|nr:glycosyltransferase family 2 protein [Gemmatimonadaceae bacterium]
ARPPLSAVLITLDAERLLADVLAALAWCDEIIVVDSGSTDRTVEIARANGARVIVHPFAGFSAQKQFAVEQAAHDWVLAIDADEIVSPELAREIQGTLGQVAAGTLPHVAFEVPRSLVFLGRLMRHGGEFRTPQLRLWNRHHGRYTPALVHERVLVEGQVGRLEGEMLHDSYAGLDDYFDKFNRYTTAAARELAARNADVGVAKVVFRFPLTFFQQYFVRGHVLNGYPGFLWALFSAMYPVVKYAKARERRRQGGRGDGDSAR